MASVLDKCHFFCVLIARCRGDPRAEYQTKPLMSLTLCQSARGWERPWRAWLGREDMNSTPQLLQVRPSSPGSPSARAKAALCQRLSQFFSLYQNFFSLASIAARADCLFFYSLFSARIYIHILFFVSFPCPRTRVLKRCWWKSSIWRSHLVDYQIRYLLWCRILLTRISLKCLLLSSPASSRLFFS